jgi:O6-methylguanine-DNA--protein-cysteine methyltransferase
MPAGSTVSPRVDREVRQRVLEHLRDHVPTGTVFHVSEIAAQLDMEYDKAYWAVEALLDEGHVVESP